VKDAEKIKAFVINARAAAAVLKVSERVP
jgi:hypothetical protein